ncbi:MAG TPA: ORF6N domain-containing protein [Steroidobacteraceae bacterium]|nr:ORF6N domain-containing protein [Steroidobacteraceae bacterium]
MAGRIECSICRQVTRNCTCGGRNCFETDCWSPESRVIPVEYIERRIYLVRAQKVMLDSDLADLYQVTTGNLNLAVKRNRTRFPADFMFQLTKEEGASLLLQSAIAKKGRGGRQTAPYAFTEPGVVEA